MLSIIENDKQMLSSEKSTKTFEDQPLSSAKLFKTFVDQPPSSLEKSTKTFDDQPLSSAKLFNFDTYAKALAATIRENSEAPLVIGIFGEWGSGKTTLMRTVESRIKNLFFLEDIDQYLFSWFDIPGNDNIRLIEILKKKFGIDWLETATIEKIDDFMTIRVFAEKKSISLKLNNDKTKVNLEIEDVRTDEFIAKTENGKLNIYIDPKSLLKKMHENPMFGNIQDDFSQNMKILLENYDGSADLSKKDKNIIVDELNRILEGAYIFNEENNLVKQKYLPNEKEQLIISKRQELEKSFLDEIKKPIFKKKNNYTARTIWFNAWKYDKEDVLWRALLIRILEELKVKTNGEETTKHPPEPLFDILKLWYSRIKRFMGRKFNSMINNPQFYVDDLKNPYLAIKLWDPENLLSNYLKEHSPSLKETLKNYNSFESLHDELNIKLEKEINKLIEIPWFKWDKFPGKDGELLTNYLKKEFNIDWVVNAKIEKIDNGNTIKILTEKNFLTFTIDNEKTKIILEIYNGYLFSWDDIPGNDNEILIEFLKKRFGIDWVKTAKIEKIDKGKTIRLSFKNNFLSLKLNDEKTKLILKIDDVRTDEFIVKQENSKLNIYDNGRTSELITEKKKLRGLGFYPNISFYEDERFRQLNLTDETQRLIKSIHKKPDKRKLKFVNILILKEIYLMEMLNKEIEDIQASLYRDVYHDKPSKLEFEPGKILRGTIKLGLSTVPMIKGTTEEFLKNIGKQKSLEDIVDSIQKVEKIERVEKVQFREQFQQRFEDIIKKYYIKNNHKKAVIFIDDLDRCLPEKALEVLEAIKLFLDVKGCIFILGINKSVIDYIVQSKYKKLMNEEGKIEEIIDYIVQSNKKFMKIDEKEEEKKKEEEIKKEGVTKEETKEEEVKEEDEDDVCITGDKYLEKIIQLSFYLPPLENNKMGELLEDLIVDFDHMDFYKNKLHKSMIEKGIENNPRKLKRFLNIMELHRNLTEDIIKNEQGEALLLEWIIIKYYHEDFRILVEKEPSKLLKIHEEISYEVLSYKEIKLTKFPFWNNKYEPIHEMIKAFHKSFINIPTEKDLWDIIHLSLTVSSTERPELEKTKKRIYKDEVIIKIKKKEKLEWMNLSTINLTGQQINRINFSFSDLSDANFNRANIRNSTLFSTILIRAQMSSVKLKDTNLSGSDLSSADISKADLYNISFRKAILAKTRLNDSTLHHCNFKDATFDEETDFTGADIDWFTIYHLMESNWKTAKWDPYVFEQLKKRETEIAQEKISMQNEVREELQTK